MSIFPFISSYDGINLEQNKVFPLYKELFVLFPRIFPRIIVMVELDGKYIVQLFNLYRSLLKSYPNLRYAQDFIGIIQWSTTNRFAIVTNNDF